MTTTPNMSLILPVDHGSADIWDVVLEPVFNLIDSHDHTTGKGVPVPSAALKINADVSWSFGGTSYAIKDALAFDMTPVAVGAVASYSSALFVNSADNNLYFRNSSGTNVQITSGATINVSIIGGIGGDYATVGALLSFDDATKRYLLQSEGTPRPWAGLATADIDLYQKAASIVNKVTLKSPSSLASSFNWIFPTALPAATQLVSVSSAGQLAVDGVLGSGVSIALTGTGYYKRGNQVRTLPFINAGWNFSSGSLPAYTSVGSKGAISLQPGTYFYAIPLTSAKERVQSITVYADAITNNATLALFTVGNDILNTFSAVTGATGTITSGGITRTVTLTPSSPANYGAGVTLWLQVVVPAAGSADLIAMDVTTDVP